MNDLTIVNVSSAVSYQETCKWLALCEDRAECKDIADKSRALEELAKRIKNTDAERRACNIRLVAERRYGELLKELARAPTANGGDVKSASARGEPIKPSPYAQALASDQISSQAASRYQALADVPQDVFDDALRSPEKPSTRGLIEKARDPQHKMPADSLWFWGRLRDFERDGYFDKSIGDLIAPMTDSMRADVRRILPLMADFFTFAKENDSDHS
ncbi:MAG: hypothetical protein IPK42_10535 [Betaproteobacteria bacterium]|nr:hypothetical protein [Betaproteobacteria bacterium]